ncbi:DUF58 domain-containing protein [Piscinibacter sp. Jin2]|uniref:DUF58 domain-containing protein n=1 Tax=Aquariibacter lacus TaxID=2801332 RepID=A0A9X0XHR5_9BURK|nr:DUF58 domain-containing protein [Piscinibacter lacus]MBL0719825.1 DUF58 domain-containing protein [Piscinibacter lacus]
MSPPADRAGPALQIGWRSLRIRPTRAGQVFALTVAGLGLASINEQLSLGHALTDLLIALAGVALLVGVLAVHGLRLSLRPVEPVHAGELARLRLRLEGGGRPTLAGGRRHGLGLSLRPDGGPLLAAATEPVWTDLPADDGLELELRLPAPRRGHHALPPLRVETRFPLGLFTVSADWQLPGRLWVWPSPRPGPGTPARAEGAGGGRRLETAVIEGLRPWRPGDAQGQIAWRASAAALARDELPLVRERLPEPAGAALIDWQDCKPGLDDEGRLQQLTQAVLDRGLAGPAWSLRLPGQTLPPGQGPAQRRAALERLARW